MNQERLPDFSKYLAVPFRDKGRGPAGWDCWGLIYYLSREYFGNKVPSYLDAYESAKKEETVSRAILAHSKAWRKIELGEELPGDVIVLNLAAKPIHAGLVVQPGFMLHCLEGRETVKECYLLNAWRQRIEGVYRWIS